jgi:hypothetical protein
MKFFRSLTLAAASLAAVCSTALAQTWTPVANVPNIQASTPLLLLDGRVLIHNGDASDWYTLTPDIHGSYVNGTWAQVASMPNGYGPLYYSSAVLPDGKVIVEGGEYNLGNSQVETNLGAIYDPVANTWTSVNPPANWTMIGDTQNVIFANGTFCMANLQNSQMAFLNESNLTWSVTTPPGKSDPNNEEGWTLLPDRSILTVDVFTPPNTERYLPGTAQWISAGSTPENIVDATDAEVGPGVLGYDGKVFWFGGDGTTGNTAIYTPPTTLMGTGTWAAGPTFPKDSSSGLFYDLADGPACVLPNGNILAFASPGYSNSPAQFFLWNGSTLAEVSGTPNTPQDSSYYGNMVLLPSGQVLFTDLSNDVEIYTPAGSPQAAWQPAITNFPSTVSINQSYTLTGTQINGLSQGSFFGDDCQTATNYPVVRITNTVTGNVVYCPTGGHSTMAISTGTTPETTNVSVPGTLDSGPSTVEVIANGIPSPKVNVNVNGKVQYSLSSVTLAPNPVAAGATCTGSVNFTDTATQAASITLASNNSQVTVPPTINLNAGQTTATFNVDTSKVTSNEQATITATCNGVMKTGSLTVNFQVQVQSLTCPHAYIMSNGTAVCYTTLTGPAPSKGAIVLLSSSNPSLLKVPASMEVPAGDTTFGFYATSGPTTATTLVKVTGTYGGASATLSVYVTESGIVSTVAATPNPVVCGANTTVTVTLEGTVAIASGVNVTLKSSNPSVAPVPTGTINVPEGKNSQTFVISTKAVTTSTPVVITATAPLGAASVTLTVQPPIITALTASATTLTSGGKTSGFVTIYGASPAAGTQVALSTSSAAITIPTSVKVAQGTTTMSFPITANTVSSQQQATITATLNGGMKTIVITVNP